MKEARFVLALALLSGCASGPRDGGITYYRQKGSHRLITPLLDADQGMDFREMRPLRLQLEEFIEERTASGPVRHIAVYFRNLNKGPWFGINDKQPFSPASLFKVPIMMVILKKAEEDDRALLKFQVVDEVEHDPGDQEIKPAERVQTGKPYTVDELIRLMIVHSDNRAHNVLLSFLDRGGFSHLFQDLGLRPPDARDEDALLTVREYASFFRILYNSSYLSRAMSIKALELLTQSAYKDGLVAGLPPGTLAAHKFGERIEKGEVRKQLHDCGIVYHPRTPYLLCVMTRGESFAAQAEAIRDISAQVYAAVEKRTD